MWPNFLKPSSCVSLSLRMSQLAKRSPFGTSHRTAHGMSRGRSSAGALPPSGSRCVGRLAPLMAGRPTRFGGFDPFFSVPTLNDCAACHASAL